MEHAREISIRQHMLFAYTVFLNMLRTPLSYLMDRSISPLTYCVNRYLEKVFRQYKRDGSFLNHPLFCKLFPRHSSRLKASVIVPSWYRSSHAASFQSGTFLITSSSSG